MPLRPRQHAFTLVELSIVLVIIGLIVGGVLVGKDMIANAEMRAQIKQIDEINTAVLTFKSKYSCLPGDCKNATSFFTDTVQPGKVSNGNGDGRIRGYDVDVPTLAHGYMQIIGTNAEWLMANDHLAAAGLISLGQFDETNSAGSNIAGAGYMLQKMRMGTFIRSASNYLAQGGNGGVVFGDELGQHRLRLGACQLDVWGTTAVVFGCAPPRNAVKRLDIKLDDGDLRNGAAQIANPGYIYNYLLGSEQRHYCDGSWPQDYDVNQECAWSIKAAF